MSGPAGAGGLIWKIPAVGGREDALVIRKGRMVLKDLPREVLHLQMQAAVENLRKNRMDAYLVSRKEDVVPQVRALLHAGDSVAVGGSETLKESGVLELLRSGDYQFIDRYAPGLTPEQVRRVFLDSLSADAYLCSANAVTMRGELYNVDGNGNRVAALCYGPASVIVSDLDEAVSRVKRMAAPANALRLSKETYCARTGRCLGLGSPSCTDGCTVPDRICSTYVVHGWQQEKSRIKVILVEEDLGL